MKGMAGFVIGSSTEFYRNLLKAQKGILKGHYRK